MGYIAVVILVVTEALIAFGFSSHSTVLEILLLPIFLFLIKGLIVISLNSSKALLLFGDCHGSVKQNLL